MTIYIDRFSLLNRLQVLYKHCLHGLYKIRYVSAGYRRNLYTSSYRQILIIELLAYTHGDSVTSNERLIQQHFSTHV